MLSLGMFLFYFMGYSLKSLSPKSGIALHPALE